ncbi:sulfotransferase family protein [Actinomadura atramentaria]|uniref:sulfotransferase family protein n=1 Tax=Actinomadura atramentaria TaxID=1990 RepID=UPI00036F463C|nr:sulfotransferase family protein [Actinomadura atramentaria]
MLTAIGAGFGRTGTSSLKAALELLGLGPCHHMKEVLDVPEQVRAWGRAAHGAPVDWGELLRGYRSAIDWPSARYWRALAARYPDARIILTERDPDAWYESTLNTIYAFSRQRAPMDDPAMRAIREMVDATVWNGVFGGRFEDRAHAIGVYLRNSEEVRAEVPADRLLVYRPGDGWEPLCDFFGLPVPAEPYPHLNDRATILAEAAERFADR